MTAKRFYRLVYFSPRPEDDERVCVAVLIYDSGRAYVEFDENLDKAHCFAPDYTKASLRFVLETMRSQAEVAAVEGRVSELSPQLQLSSERILRTEVDERVRDILRNKYLLKPKAADRRPRRHGRGPGPKIDLYLSRYFGRLAGEVQKRVGAESMFGPAASELPRDLVPHSVSRAVVADDRVLLLDGVDLHLASTDALVHQVDRVARTYWQVEKAREYLGADKSKIFRAALIFDGDGPSVEAELRWRQDYALDRFGKNADRFVKVGSEEQERMLQTDLKGLRLLGGGS